MTSAKAKGNTEFWNIDDMQKYIPGILVAAHVFI